MSKHKEAEQYQDKAQKEQKPAWWALRFSPDTDTAILYARQAVSQQRPQTNTVQKCSLQLRALHFLIPLYTSTEQYVLAANACDDVASLYITLSNLENDKDIAYCNKAIEKYREGASYCVIDHRIDKACMIQAKAAKTQKEKTTGNWENTVGEQMEEICNQFEKEQNAQTSETYFKDAISYFTQAKNYDKAIDQLERQNKQYRQRLDQYENDLHKNYLCIFVLLLTQKKYDKAQKILHDWEEDPSIQIGETRVGAICSELLLGISSNDSGVILRKLQNTSVLLRRIDSNIARIAQSQQPDPDGFPHDRYDLHLFENDTVDVKKDNTYVDEDVLNNLC